MLEKLRSGEPLTAKEQQIHDQGLVTVLRQIHDELDEAVLEAYGWSDLRSRDILVANKDAPHSCGVGESAADAPREALSPSTPLSPSRQECRDSLWMRPFPKKGPLSMCIHDRSTVAPYGKIVFQSSFMLMTFHFLSLASAISASEKVPILESGP